MNITSVFSSSRSTSNLVSRFGTIFSRFGITSGKFEKLLADYSSLATRAGCIATLPITAVILKRHPELIRKYVNKGLEFAIHGYVHIDYRQLAEKDQFDHFKKAIETFHDCRVPYTGFRAPYLRFNRETAPALNSLEFLYDSSDSVYWNVMEKTDFSEETWNEYHRVLDFYQARSSDRYLSLPRIFSDRRLVEIPVSLPDDEALVERLGITAAIDILRIWKSILTETHRRGELFTLSLHPERISLCGDALTALVNQSKTLQPRVWTATVAEIAEWWKEKTRYRFDIRNEGQGRYQINTLAAERATVLVKNYDTDCQTLPWSGGYRIPTEPNFQLSGSRYPAIGVSPGTSPEAIHFLQSEGFQIEVGARDGNYGLFFSGLKDFQPGDGKSLVDTIEQSSAPLLRFSRWPDKAKSALSVTGDIDSITLFDFALRLFEARQSHKIARYQGKIASAGAAV
jgi:hypothetical protein